MDFLLNPNVAYVMLVIGFLLTMLAIVTPGTGMLEVGALFLLALVAYIAYQVGFNPWSLIVLILSLVPLFGHQVHLPDGIYQYAGEFRQGARE